MNNNDEMKSEYRFDYSKARPNRFAEEYHRNSSIVNLEADVAEAFPDSESVNEALRFLIRITTEHKAELNLK
jgi:hypothetical protein